MKLKFMYLIIAGAILFSCSNSKDNQSQPLEKPKKIMIESYQIQKNETEKFRTFSGIVASKKTAIIVPKITGYIQDIHLKEGDKFKHNDVLLTIKSDELLEKEKFAVASVEEAENGLAQGALVVDMAKSSYRQAEANYNLAFKTYERFKSLLKNESVSKQEFDEVEAKYKSALEGKNLAEKNIKLAEEKVKQFKIKKTQAEAMLAETRTLFGYTTVKAPFDGLVLEKLTDTGNLASYNTPVLKIGTFENEIIVNLPEDFFKSVKVRNSIDVIISSLGEKFNTEVVEVARNIDPVTRTFKVKVKGNQKIVPGMYAELSVRSGYAKKISIPKDFIFERGQLKMVFINKEGNAEMRIVRTGRVESEYIEIVSGLNGNEELVKPVDNSEINSGDTLEVK